MLKRYAEIKVVDSPMETILSPYQVPWAISPTMSGVTLIHSESDIKPTCEVVFGAGRLTSEGRIDMRRISMIFTGCYFARTGFHDDCEGVESIGYKVNYPGMHEEGSEYLVWRKEYWLREGYCPDSGLYKAESSEWLSSIPERFRANSQHYVVDGRDGYVELIAQGFQWSEWLWERGLRDELPAKESIVASGTSKV